MPCWINALETRAQAVHNAETALESRERTTTPVTYAAGKVARSQTRKTDVRSAVGQVNLDNLMWQVYPNNLMQTPTRARARNPLKNTLQDLDAGGQRLNVYDIFCILLAAPPHALVGYNGFWLSSTRPAVTPLRISKAMYTKFTKDAHCGLSGRSRHSMR